MRRFHSRSAWRPLAVVLLFLGIAMTIGAAGAGAQELSCSDFDDPEVAQYLLDIAPSYADALDPNGDGFACAEGDDQRSPGDAGASAIYLEDVRTQVELVQDDLVRFAEIDAALQDPTLLDAEVDALVEESFGIIDLWILYPELAFVVELQAPIEYMDISEAHLDLADTLAEAGNLLYDAIAAEPGSAEQTGLLMEFGDAYDSALAATDEILEMIDVAAADLAG